MRFPFTFYGTLYLSIMQIKQVKETCLYSRQLEETKEFYTKFLGLTVHHYLPGKHLFLKAGTSMLLFFNPDASRVKETLPPHYGEGKMHIAFEVPANEYEVSKEAILSAGIAIIHEEQWSKENKSFYFSDPNEHILEIVIPGLWD